MLTKEEAAAWRIASLATAGASGELAKFSGWLMTALGAALTFFVANHSSVAEIIDVSYLRLALFFFTGSMLLGLLAQWLSVPVKAGLAFSSEALQLRSQQLDPIAFVKAFASLLIFPYRCLFLHRVASAKGSDALAPIRSPSKLSQYQALLILLQYLFAIAIVLTVALGVKV